MAPEQATGRPITPQTDIYALGVMLYEMLTGQAPFNANTPMAVAMLHVQGAFRLPGELNPALSPAVEKVVLQAMAKEPANRYRSAGEMAVALERASEANARIHPAGLPAVAAQIAANRSTGEITMELRRELRKQDQLAKRRKVMAIAPWAAAGLLVLGLAGGLALSLSGGLRSRQAGNATSTAVALLYGQLNDAQTAIAAGAAGSEATLAHLQTLLADIPPAAAGAATSTPGQEVAGGTTPAAPPATAQPSQTGIGGGGGPAATPTSPFLPSNTAPAGSSATSQATDTTAASEATSLPVDTQPPDTSVPPTAAPQPTAVPPTTVPQPTNTHPSPPDPTRQPTKKPSKTPNQ
jgi:serine/threonine-protein kinase